MDLTKKEGDQISFNLSPTSINMYYKSPLLFYLQYIAKVPDDTPVPVCYGISGNIVHDCLEKYANGELDMDGACFHLATKWTKRNLHMHKDINGNTLSQTQYLTAMLSGMHIIDQHDNHICEEMINFPFKENENLKIGVKGIIDLQATTKHDNQPIIIDYKTSNSINKGRDFERQALFYNFLLHKKKNIIPVRTTFHYLKLNTPKHYSFTINDIKTFEEELRAIADEILSYGTDISNYPIGDIDDLFNSKKQACLREIARRNMLMSEIIQ